MQEVLVVPTPEEAGMGFLMMAPVATPNTMAGLTPGQLTDAGLGFKYDPAVSADAFDPTCHIWPGQDIAQAEPCTDFGPKGLECTAACIDHHYAEGSRSRDHIMDNYGRPECHSICGISNHVV